MKILRLASLTKRALPTALVLALVPTSTACKPKEKKVVPAAVVPETVSPETEPSEVDAPKRVPASEAEVALAKEFIPRFATIIDASKSDGWLELQSKAQRERLLEKDAVEQSYEAWVVGTKPVIEEIKSSEFRLEKIPNDQLLLTFDSIVVPNDRERVYEMHLKVEEGKILLDEN